MRVLAIDPGANPGFCITEGGVIMSRSYDPDVYDGETFDEVVIEGQFSGPIYRDGKRVRVSRKSQQSLSFTAGRLFQRFPAARKYSIKPDEWRRLCWPGAYRLTKTVVLARLRPAYGHWVVSYPKKHQADVLEAIGIAMAWAGLTQEQKEKYLVE